MPTIRYVTAVASEYSAHAEGEERTVSAAEAQRVVASGVAELVTEERPQTPEAAGRRRTPRPETRSS